MADPFAIRIQVAAPVKIQTEVFSVMLAVVEPLAGVAPPAVHSKPWHGKLVKVGVAPVQTCCWRAQRQPHGIPALMTIYSVQLQLLLVLQHELLALLLLLWLLLLL